MSRIIANAAAHHQSGVPLRHFRLGQRRPEKMLPIKRKGFRQTQGAVLFFTANPLPFIGKPAPGTVLSRATNCSSTSMTSKSPVILL